MRSKWIRTFLTVTMLSVVAPLVAVAPEASAAPAPPKPKVDCTKAQNKKKPECLPKDPKAPAGNGEARQIELDDPNAPKANDGPVVAGTPTDEALTAKKLFDNGKWAEAAIALYRVWGGPAKDAKSGTGDDEGNRQDAQFHLAVALFKLQLYQASFFTFSDIADKPNHVKFEETLLWLSRLATTLPEPADIIGKVSKYSSDKLDRFNNPKQQELFWQLNYMIGRSKYNGRDFKEAISLFNKVDKKSKFFIQSQFFNGISYVEERQSTPAVQSFQRVVTALDAGTDVEDEARMRDLAYLSMARTYYTASIQRDVAADTISVEPKKLTLAVKNWNKIDIGSEYWLDGLFEESWAYFMAGLYPQALGNIHTLQAPFFPKSFYPEAEILRAQIYFATCQYDQAKTIVARFKKKYEPISNQLQDVLNRFADKGKEPEAFQFLKDLKANKTTLSDEIKPIVENALSDRVLLKHVEYVKMLDEEEGRYKKFPAGFKESPVGKYVDDALNLSKDVAVQNAGALVQAKYTQNIEDVSSLLSDANKILIDITTAERTRLEGAAESGSFTKEDAKVFGVIKPDEEHVIWPFNGEYWRDELGFYRQVVVSQCGR